MQLAFKLFFYQDALLDVPSVASHPFSLPTSFSFSPHSNPPTLHRQSSFFFMNIHTPKRKAQVGYWSTVRIAAPYRSFVSLNSSISIRLSTPPSLASHQPLTNEFYNGCLLHTARKTYQPSPRHSPPPFRSFDAPSTFTLIQHSTSAAPSRTTRKT
jgi:hypothetical protein